jgi:hypothetical protein
LPTVIVTLEDHPLSSQLESAARFALKMQLSAEGSSEVITAVARPELMVQSPDTFS